jgi:hypothetical protein
MALRTGIAIATLFIKELCRVLNVYRNAINGVINAAVSAGTISSVQRDILFTWLDGAQAACDIIRIVSGY